MNKHSFRLWQTSALALAAAPLLLACSGQMPTTGEDYHSTEQALTGSLEIKGRITSPTGAPLSGVKVTLTGAASKSVTTGTNGAYSFTALAAGGYTVTPSKTGLAFCTASAALPKLRGNAVEDFSGSSGGCQAPVHTRNATVVIYDPLITKSDGTKVTLSTYQNWDDPTQLVDRFKRSIQSMTNGRVKYNVVKTKIINDFPVKADGFKYTQASYLACMADSSQCHAADEANVLATLSTEGVCTDVNSGTTDELWLFGGPYFGYYESQLTGPKAFWYNSPALMGSTCTKLLPIMGFNYERSLPEMVHDMLHRTESTMARVYGSWEENRVATNWDKFALAKAQSPSFNYSGSVRCRVSTADFSAAPVSPGRRPLGEHELACAGAPDHARAVGPLPTGARCRLRPEHPRSPRLRRRGVATPRPHRARLRARASAELVGQRRCGSGAARRARSGANDGSC
jgi:hypothetical protein